ncbi:MAG TPA: hypothetical protein VG759_12460 [Candidatus Angelobacter sp.]|nr:hypothetical protein [Candidatus Angelobacter sp.]
MSDGKQTFPRLSVILMVCMSTVAAMGQLGSNVPSDQQLLQQRNQERSSGFVVATPPAGKVLRPVERVPRERFGVVGNFPLKSEDLNALVYPSLLDAERKLLLEGMQFFTTPHTAEEGGGPMNNQPFCLGCHESTAEQPPIPGVVNPDSCIPGSPCVSLVSRAARSSPTNHRLVGFDPATGAGRAPDNVDALNNTGKTAAFTTFGDFSLALNVFDPLDGTFVNPVTNATQAFGGFVQHVRPSVTACLPKPLPSLDDDINLVGRDATNLSTIGFRRSVGERAGPPYIGRGLMEAVPTNDILANEDPQDILTHASTLGVFAAAMGCGGDCIAGRHNEIPAKGGFVGGVGRFGLRANGVEILQFTTGGLQGELSFTSLLNMNEINLAPINAAQPGCKAAFDNPHGPEVHLSIPFSERNFIRNTAPPEFGDALLHLLQSPDPAKRRDEDGFEAKVQRGAELFGIDLEAFANRMVAGRMPASGDDGLDPHAINQRDRKLNCVGCHIPVHRTGQSPAEVGAQNLSFVWAPIFSDFLLHENPVIDAERFATRTRDPLVIARVANHHGDNDDDRSGDNHARGQDGDTGRPVFATFDLPRSLTDDTFSNQKGSATGRDFRTAPLMGLGRMGAPFLHDARVFLSRLTVDSEPAGTVTTNKSMTNAPLVVRTLDDAILAAIELHDLPAPDDKHTPNVAGAGCPVPPPNAETNVAYGPSPEKVICPAYDSDVSKANRSEAREVIRRFRTLSREDQEALIAFLRQL